MEWRDRKGIKWKGIECVVGNEWRRNRIELNGKKFNGVVYDGMERMKWN